jgi:hypothetical protein
MKSKRSIILLAVVIIFCFLTISVYAESNANLPQSFEELYADLDQVLSAESRENIKTCEYDDLIQYHFGLGTMIRNTYIYPALQQPPNFITEFMDKVKIGHPDNMSQYIIEGYHHYLNGKIYNIEEQKKIEHEQNIQFLYGRILLLAAFLIIMVTGIFVSRKIRTKENFSSKLGPKILRVPIIIVVSAILTLIFDRFIIWISHIFAEDDFLTNSQQFILELIEVCFIALVFVIVGNFCFRNMSKKDIFISSICPCAYIAIVFIILEFIGIVPFIFEIPMMNSAILAYTLVPNFPPLWLRIITSFLPMAYILYGNKAVGVGVHMSIRR